VSDVRLVIEPITGRSPRYPEFRKLDGVEDKVLHRSKGRHRKGSMPNRSD
jgi:hypothetical protein